MKRTLASLAVLALALSGHVATARTAQQALVKPGAPHANAAGGCALVNSGGPVIQNVKIIAVYWTSAAATQQKQLDAFYADVVQSPYMDWLSEYNTTSPVQKIGRGTFVASYVDPAPPTPTGGATVIDDSEIGPYIFSLIAAKKIPDTDPNSFYVVNFPPGMTVNASGSSSCNSGGQFCAYHAGYQDPTSNKIIRYTAMPDLVACNGGCGGTADPLASVTVTTSHELIEAITDPDGWNQTKTWYDNGACSPAGEIGDICNGQGGKANTQAVQLEWSNTQGGCFDNAPPNQKVTVADFSLAIDKAMLPAPIGGTATAKVTSTPVGTLMATVNVVASGLPMGVTAAFAPASFMTNASSVVTFTVPAGTAPGSYPFTITGNTALPDNVIHTVTGTLTVVMPPPPDMARPIIPDMAQPVMTGGGGSGGNGGGTGGNGANGGNNPGIGRGSSGGCSVAGSTAASGAWILGLLCVVAIIARRRNA